MNHTVIYLIQLKIIYLKTSNSHTNPRVNRLIFSSNKLALCEIVNLQHVYGKLVAHQASV